MLVELYQQKLALFKKLSNLTDAMAKYTAQELYNDDAASERFMNLLAERSSIMEQIDLLDGEIEATEGKKEQDTETLATLNHDLQATMVKIESQNELIEQVVKENLGKIREQAKKLQDGKQSNRAYIGRVPSSEGSFIDKRR